MRPLVRLAMLVAALLFAAFIGFHAGRQLAATEIASLKARVENEQQKVQAERSERQKLKSDAEKAAGIRGPVAAAPAPSPTSDLMLGAADRLRLLAQLQNAKVIGVGMNILTREGKIADSFVTLVGLSEAEKTALQRTMDEGRERMDQLILASTTTSREADTFVISVKPLEQGPAVYDQVMDGFQRILGPDRYASFVTLAGKGISNFFDQFGAEQRQITFWREQSGDGTPTVMASDIRTSGAGGSGGVTGKREFDNLPAMYQWMKKYAPEVSMLPPRPNQPPKK